MTWRAAQTLHPLDRLAAGGEAVVQVFPAFNLTRYFSAAQTVFRQRPPTTPPFLLLQLVIKVALMVTPFR